MAYCNCYQITLKECLQEIVIAGGFTPFTDYHVFITDKFDSVEHLEIIANYSGNLIITVSDLPKGIFMSFSGSYSIQVFEEVVEGESCPVQPTGDAVVMEFCSGNYDCIDVSFQENEDDTVSQTIPDCDAEQTEIDEPFTAPQPYEDSFCPAVKKCIGIKSNGSDTKVLNEKGLFVEVPTGPEGPSGPAGADGADGADGLSAYEVAVDNGFVGTEADWLLSLKGDTGATGAAGPNEVSASTATNINAPLAGNGTNVLALTAAIWGAFVNALTDKTTPIDTDSLTISDSADSNNAKKLSWANLKATLKTYFDTLYNPGQVLLQTATANGDAYIGLTIPAAGTYANYMIIIEGAYTDGTIGPRTIQSRFGTGSPITYHSAVGDYRWGYFGTTSNNSAASGSSIVLAASNVGDAFPATFNCVLYLFDPYSNRDTNAVFQSVYRSASTTLYVINGGGFMRGDLGYGAVTGVQILTNNGETLKAGTFKLYGLK